MQAKKSGVWQPLSVNNRLNKKVRHAKLEAKQKRLKAKRKRKQNARHGLPESPPRNSWGTYAEYLRTTWWKARRKLAMRRAGFKCNRCPNRRPLQVHHKTYVNLGCEVNADLEVLCRGCHQREHAAIIEQNAHIDAILGR